MSRLISFAPSRFFVALVFSCLLASGPVHRCEADDAGVRFDVPATLPFVSTNLERLQGTEQPPQLAGRRWIDLDLPVSHWLGAASPEVVDELLIEIVEVSGNAMVIDHWPRALMASDYAGPIAVERSSESQHGLTADLTGGASSAVGGLHASASLRHSEIERFERLPPQHQVVSSGTVQQGRGVAFRFRRSIEIPLEGMQRVQLRLSLPEGATNGLLRVDCRALSGAPDSRQARRMIGGERMWVAMFDAESVDARMKAERLAQASWQLREAARQEEIHRQNQQRNAFRKIERLLAPESQHLPADWLEQLLTDGANSEFVEFAERLTYATRQSSEAYLATRRDLLGTTR